MKKIVKSAVLFLVIGMALVLLTGCGGNKLVATKTTEDEMFGKYEEKIEVSFKDDKASEVKMTYEFEEEAKATSMYGLFNLGLSKDESGELEGFKVEQNGKKVVMTMDAKLFAEQEGATEEEMTKDAIKASLEEEGYTVK